jgi:hypothetical protein
MIVSGSHMDVPESDPVGVMLRGACDDVSVAVAPAVDTGADVITGPDVAIVPFVPDVAVGRIPDDSVVPETMDSVGETSVAFPVGNKVGPLAEVERLTVFPVSVAFVGGSERTVVGVVPVAVSVGVVREPVPESVLVGGTSVEVLLSLGPVGMTVGTLVGGLTVSVEVSVGVVIGGKEPVDDDPNSLVTVPRSDDIGGRVGVTSVLLVEGVRRLDRTTPSPEEESVVCVLTGGTSVVVVGVASPVEAGPVKPSVRVVDVGRRSVMLDNNEDTGFEVGKALSLVAVVV